MSRDPVAVILWVSWQTWIEDRTRTSCVSYETDIIITIIIITPVYNPLELRT